MTQCRICTQDFSPAFGTCEQCGGDGEIEAPDSPMKTKEQQLEEVCRLLIKAAGDPVVEKLDGALAKLLEGIDPMRTLTTWGAPSRVSVGFASAVITSTDLIKGLWDT